MKRKETLLLEKKLKEKTREKRVYGCEEVTIGFHGKGGGKEIVDFMSMDSKGILKCYEIKVSLADLKSNAKKSWYGHYNYLVVTKDLFSKISDWDEFIPNHVGILCGESLTSKRKADIEELIIKAGAKQFVSGFKDDAAMIGFILGNRQIRFILPLRNKTERRFHFTPRQGRKRTPEAAFKEWEQCCRAKWRALYLIIKAKLEAVESGISTIEREFFYDTVLPNGQTVGELTTPPLKG